MKEPTAAPGLARRVLRPLLTVAVILSAALLAFSCSGCSPVYVARAGWAEMKILSARRPLGEVISDPGTDEETRRKLLLARQARALARHILEMDVGDQYTSYSRLESDTLAWILSAARRDRLESKTWWFPIVGKVPYKGYFSRGAAEEEQRKLEAEGYDTYLRPTSAFSTLGWFSDPILSSFLRYDDVDLVATVIHELAHAHLWVPGHVTFNESYATFVGQTGAIRFFCGPPGVVANPETCREAEGRWKESVAFSDFLDRFLLELRAIYAREDLDSDQKILARGTLLRDYRDRLHDDPSTVRAVRVFLDRPLNNAVLLARMRYYHRLGDFGALLGSPRGDLPSALRTLKERAPAFEDPFRALPSTSR